MVDDDDGHGALLLFELQAQLFFDGFEDGSAAGRIGRSGEGGRGSTGVAGSGRADRAHYRHGAEGEKNREVPGAFETGGVLYGPSEVRSDVLEALGEQGHGGVLALQNARANR